MIDHLTYRKRPLISKITEIFKREQQSNGSYIHLLQKLVMLKDALDNSKDVMFDSRPTHLEEINPSNPRDLFELNLRTNSSISYRETSKARRSLAQEESSPITMKVGRS